jgi:hypothetical protein
MIYSGLIWFIHFGTPCKSWGPAARLNHGTRSQERPGGDGSLAREDKGNVEADVTALLCDAVATIGGYFCVENPQTSLLFVYDKMKAVLCKYGCETTLMHQCAYGLKLPGASKYEFCRKATNFVSNMKEICILHKLCPGINDKHKHLHAWGSAKVGGKAVSRAKAAGAYPRELCCAYSQVLLSFSRSHLELTPSVKLCPETVKVLRGL